MKAKMPNKPAEAARYMCMLCNSEFDFRWGSLTCPVCGNSNRREMIAIDVRDNPDEEILYTPDDWHGG